MPNLGERLLFILEWNSERKIKRKERERLAVKRPASREIKRPKKRLGKNEKPGKKPGGCL